MEKLIRDHYPKITKHSPDPITWRYIVDVEEHVRLLLEKVWEEEREFEIAHKKFLNYADAIEGGRVEEYESRLWEALREIADVLEVYEVLLEIENSLWGDRVHKVQQSHSQFVRRILEYGYHLERVEQLQLLKRAVYGSFRRGIVGIFPDTEKL